MTIGNHKKRKMKNDTSCARPGYLIMCAENNKRYYIKANDFDVFIFLTSSQSEKNFCELSNSIQINIDIVLIILLFFVLVIFRCNTIILVI